MNAINEPRRVVTLQEESDAVGTTVVTDNGLTKTVQLLKDESLLGFSKNCGCREWVRVPRVGFKRLRCALVFSAG